MTLPALVKDWPEDAYFEWKERAAIRLEQWGGKASAAVERQQEWGAEVDVRRQWAARRTTT